MLKNPQNKQINTFYEECFHQFWSTNWYDFFDKVYSPSNGQWGSSKFQNSEANLKSNVPKIMN